MTFRVILLDQAEADIEANARWWATHHSVEQAANWFEAVHRQLKSLEQFPESNALSAENGEFPYATARGAKSHIFNPCSRDADNALCSRVC